MDYSAHDDAFTVSASCDLKIAKVRPGDKHRHIFGNRTKISYNPFSNTAYQWKLR